MMVLPSTLAGRGTALPPETECLMACLAGDTAAFEPIVRAHEGRLYMLLAGLTGDHELARDLLQETFLRAWRRLQTFDLSRPLAPWLAAVARSCWKDHRRKACNRKPHLSIESDKMPPLPIRGPMPDEGAICSERAEVLWEAFRRLPENEREILLLKDLQELPYDEVASTLAVPRGTVASRVFYARRHLRELLETEDAEILTGVR